MCYIYLSTFSATFSPMINQYPWARTHTTELTNEQGSAWSHGIPPANQWPTGAAPAMTFPFHGWSSPEPKNAKTTASDTRMPAVPQKTETIFYHQINFFCRKWSILE